MNCPDINYPLTTACGGGVCINKTQCLCPPSWSGKGDFVYGEPHCNDNIHVLTAFWGFALFYSGVLTLPCFFVTISHAQANILADKKFYDSNFFKMCLCAFAEVLFANFVGLLKLIYPERQMGTDPAVTLTYVFATGFLFNSILKFLYCVVELYSDSLLQFQRSIVVKLVFFLKKVGPAYLAITMFTAVIPVFMLFGKSTNDYFCLTVLYYLCCSFCNMMCTYLMVAIINPILNNINESIEIKGKVTRPAEKKALAVMQHISFKFTVFRNVILCLGIFNSFFMLNMSGWVYLQSLSSYYVPFLNYTGTTFSGLVVFISFQKPKYTFCNFKKKSEIPKFDKKYETNLCSNNPIKKINL
jgi:hypothetical protein